jgi:hypothetical protein
MEGFYRPSQRVQNLDAYAQLAHDLFGQKQAIGACCFSDIHDNELMWTHYAGNYSGICVSYRARKLLEGLPDHAHLVRLSIVLEDLHGLGRSPISSLLPAYGTLTLRSPSASAEKADLS